LVKTTVLLSVTVTAVPAPAARREQMQQIMAELRQVEPTSSQHRLLQDQLQQLLNEEENS
jgi:hypothetical protein